MLLKAVFISVVFFIVGLFTLPSYGINWDTINHLPRGQAYLHYFLTGDKDYSRLPEFFTGWPREGRWYWQKPESLSIDADIPKSEVPKRSMYQNDATTFDWFLEHDGGGHPPLSDILSSAFNLVLFQKLGLINDIDSYRIYGVLLAAMLVGLVFWWTSTVYKSNFAGLVAVLSLALYPLFWSESHFNTEKDIPETVFWGFLLFSVWKGVIGKSWKWILLSGIFFGLALGTKFNVLFIPFVILPWLAAVLGGNYLKKKFQISEALRKNIKLIAAAFVAPFIGFGIFLASWPYLWPDPIARLGKVIGFYKGLGLTQSIDPLFLGPFGTSTFPLQWILYTTPLVILGLGILALFAALLRIKKEKDKASLLFLLWLIVPITRVTWPGTTVYGGVRQIMEYIPAMAILAGLGGMWLFDRLAKNLSKNLAFLIVILPFAFLILNLYKIHPNENVYFNPLIGGLSGAKEKNFPFWGLSFGAPYRQGAIWLNKNAEKDARIAYAYELIPNIPRIFLRQDFSLHNTHRSGAIRNGEYAITLTYQGTSDRTYYDSYLERILEPVYVVEVDNIPILKIWKNSEEHTQKNFLYEEKITDIPVITDTENGFRIDLGKVYVLSMLQTRFQTDNCNALKSGYSQISEDGMTWKKLPGILPGEDWNTTSYGVQPQENSFIQPFAAEKARYIDYIVEPIDACFGHIQSIEVFHFSDVK